MEDEERLTVRISSEDLLLLSDLVNRGRYVSELDAVRSAIRTLIDSEYSASEKECALEKIRKLVQLDLNDFTSNQDKAENILGNVIHNNSDLGEE